MFKESNKKWRFISVFAVVLIVYISMCSNSYATGHLLHHPLLDCPLEECTVCEASLTCTHVDDTEDVETPSGGNIDNNVEFSDYYESGHGNSSGEPIWVQPHTGCCSASIYETKSISTTIGSGTEASACAGLSYSGVNGSVSLTQSWNDESGTQQESGVLIEQDCGHPGMCLPDGKEIYFQIKIGGVTHSTSWKRLRDHECTSFCSSCSIPFSGPHSGDGDEKGDGNASGQKYTSISINYMGTRTITE